MAAGLRIAGQLVAPGETATLQLHAGQLYTHEPVNMPVHVINGRKPGPVLFVSAALHGDELNGIEIARRLLQLRANRRIAGALIVIPIVNVLGVVHRSRYLPDRRDLNRCFPGSPAGSLGARMAHQFMQEIVGPATHGIDLHTGAVHRENLPQVRIDLTDGECLRMARAFGAPLVLGADLRPGSLREAATGLDVPVLVYEAGEALRFDEKAIRIGVRGIAQLMAHLGMLPKAAKPDAKPFVARSSRWVRAPISGVFRALVKLGKSVERGQTLGVVSDPFGGQEHEVKAEFKGLVVGKTNLPLVHEGDALYHVGRLTSKWSQQFRSDLDQLADPDPMLEEQPPIV